MTVVSHNPSLPRPFDCAVHTIGGKEREWEWCDIYYCTLLIHK